jgi:hypothetical protein
MVHANEHVLNVFNRLILFRRQRVGFFGQLLLVSRQISNLLPLSTNLFAISKAEHCLPDFVQFIIGSD